MTAEKKVGLLTGVTFILALGFAWLLTSYNPFSNSTTLIVGYNYAGGIEVGSPVRVMGIKVGRVQSIDFHPGTNSLRGDRVSLLLRISVSKDSLKTLRADSQFFINLAGVIGEKFVEISAGSEEAGPMQTEGILRGEDPPRIDQLISQSYGLAGKVIEFINKNEGSAISTIDSMNRLLVNLEKALKQLDKTTSNKEVNRLFTNMVSITDDVSFLTKKLRSEDSQKTFDLLDKLVWRLEGLDAKTLRKFLQQEGIKAKIF